MKSKKYKKWHATPDEKTCLECAQRDGKIYTEDQINDSLPPLHPYCRCVVEWIDAVDAGTATRKGKNGVDLWLKNHKELPDDYLPFEEVMEKEWDPILGDPFPISPGKTLFGGIFKNRNGLLPDAPKRIWYEADIEYEWGFRGPDRIVFSNDGLIFVTHDHYKSFQHVI